MSTTRGRWRKVDGEGEAERLLWEVGVLLERLAAVQPSDVLTVPLIVPTDLAAILDERGRASGVPVPHLYSSCLMLGAWHAATDNGRVETAQRIAGIIKRYAPKEEWTRFVARHPEMEARHE